ncbi:Peroxidase [Portunus trituberculatus]|uniref:Peroxidase n=1 Tax=Portunus trituberculatus TaxID=210409 RepID=A0A5B7D3X3_PORTR|nr:Peroxidase [Portunus trituberculatus]
MYDQVLRGMIRARLEVIDLKLTDAILNHLFQLPDDPFSGQDLMALNIARGRDHAIAPYVEYLNMCEGLNVTTFEELEERMKPEPLRNIRDVYRDVRDVDLIVGSLAESTSSKVKTMVGPTMRCIIGLQFLYLKRGDRFWFENRIAGFTPEQLTSLRQSSLSRVVCDSLNGTDATAPRKALKMSSRTARKCSDLTGTDLELWREEPGSQPHNPSACQKDLTVTRPVVSENKRRPVCVCFNFNFSNVSLLQNKTGSSMRTFRLEGAWEGRWEKGEGVRESTENKTTRVVAETAGEEGRRAAETAHKPPSVLLCHCFRYPPRPPLTRLLLACLVFVGRKPAHTSALSKYISA